MTTDSARELQRLAAQFFDLQNRVDPLGATLLGVVGYDHLLPDFSRDASNRHAREFRALEDATRALDVTQLSRSERTNARVLEHLAFGARADLEANVWEANAGSEGYATPPSMIFMCVPAAGARDEAAAERYLTRLRALADCFDVITERYGQALADGRHSTRAGIARLIEQLEGHLAAPLDDDILAHPVLGDIDQAAFLGRTYDLVERNIRPAIARLVTLLRGPMSDVARDDDHVGLCHLEGGAPAYALSVRRHTPTLATPEEIHAKGLAQLDRLDREWAELGQRVLGTRDLPEILQRLRSDPSLRCTSSGQIVATVSDALSRADAALASWFVPRDIAPCVVEEINPIEAQSAALAHYRPPAADGSRPGAHCVSTIHPESRFIYEYEALAFHESVPGHHLQIATAQSLSELPDFRRYLDVQVCAFVEGWGLYSERLADEMGLYSSDVARLGMLSFDALRACRLVVDTGMHALGWSRQRAIDFMWSHTATTMANVTNEIDRYIAWPGQALAYMTGRLEIERLRALAQAALGERFDVRDFHALVLDDGAVPLGVLAANVAHWINDVNTRETT